jgi:hypothetical protein
MPFLPHLRYMPCPSYSSRLYHIHRQMGTNCFLFSISIFTYAPNEQRHENAMLPVLADCLRRNITSWPSHETYSSKSRNEREALITAVLKLYEHENQTKSSLKQTSALKCFIENCLAHWFLLYSLYMLLYIFVWTSQWPLHLNHLLRNPVYLGIQQPPGFITAGWGAYKLAAYCCPSKCQ